MKFYATLLQAKKVDFLFIVYNFVENKPPYELPHPNCSSSRRIRFAKNK